MSIAELLLILSRASALGFKIYDRVQAGEMTPEEGLAKWKQSVSRIEEEHQRFQQLMGDE